METSAGNVVRNIINHWWLILIAGILLTGIGIWIIISPFQSFLSLCLAVAIGMIASGCFEILFSIKNHKLIKGWGWLFGAGIIDLIIGCYLFNYPLITMVLLPLVVSVWIAFRGMIALGNALQIRSYGSKSWRWLALTAVTIILIALLILLYPIYGIKALIFWTGIAFILSGLFRIYLSFKFKKIKELREL
ncbi:HdeD family acid-resistance protein [Mucilaginibacter puniceus]